VSLEVVARLPGGDEDCIKQLMDLHVPRLGLMEDIVDIVHRSLEGLDPLGGGGGSGASIFIGAGSGSSQSSRSRGTSEVQDPTTVWS
jgi:hypothetical protein